MARSAEPGRVKTRLAAQLGSDVALRLHSAMVGDTLDLARRLSPSLRGVAVYWTPGGAPAGTSGGMGLGEAPFPAPTPAGNCTTRHEVQEGDTFAIRLGSSMRRELADGPVICIGTDSPTLPPEYLSRAVDWLHEERSSLVLGPAADGGYYLIGMNLWIREMFEGIDWGTSNVLEQSIERARIAEVKPLLLPEWYDIDRPEDLIRFRQDAASAPRAAAVIAEFR